MSAFICNPKHFNDIKHNLNRLLNNEDFYFPYSLRNICFASDWATLQDVEIVENQLSGFIDTLIDLNVKTVCLKYHNPEEDNLLKDIKINISFAKSKTRKDNLSIVELYKAFNCLDYQIEMEWIKRELTEEEKNALLFLKEIQTRLAEFIVQNGDEWKKAKWSID